MRDHVILVCLKSANRLVKLYDMSIKLMEFEGRHRGR